MTGLDRRSFLKSACAGIALTGLPAAKSAHEIPQLHLSILLWCWDARMTWDDEPATIVTRMAAAEQAFPYPKRPESFLAGCKRLVDYCADTGVRGFTLWGFLRV